MWYLACDIKPTTHYDKEKLLMNRGKVSLDRLNDISGLRPNFGPRVPGLFPRLHMLDGVACPHINTSGNVFAQVSTTPPLGITPNL